MSRPRDSRGRFVRVTATLRIGEHRIGVHGERPRCAAPRRTHPLAVVVAYIVGLFSLNALAKSWGAPDA